MTVSTGSPAAGSSGRDSHRAGCAGTPTISNPPGRDMVPAISVEFVRECFALDTETGALYWLERPSHHFKNEKSRAKFNDNFCGKRADVSVYPTKGYLRVRVTYLGRKVAISAHRIVFALANGRWPQQTVDHIDRDKTNNAPSNLRDVSQGENNKNRAAYKASTHRSAAQWARDSASRPCAAALSSAANIGGQA